MPPVKTGRRDGESQARMNERVSEMRRVQIKSERILTLDMTKFFVGPQNTGRTAEKFKGGKIYRPQSFSEGFYLSEGGRRKLERIMKSMMMALVKSDKRRKWAREWGLEWAS